MTREEAIQILEDGEWWNMLDIWYQTANPEFEKLFEAVDLALAALRAQQEAEKMGKEDYGKRETLCRETNRGNVY